MEMCAPTRGAAGGLMRKKAAAVYKARHSGNQGRTGDSPPPFAPIETLVLPAVLNEAAEGQA